ncbi:MAG TPA: efflux transporter outer membrane subunit, partial [Gammaproteobacteria bacterium]|nr:efflux transporter outer membrane subunit [Gammaproteobacteria bacterium]
LPSESNLPELDLDKLSLPTRLPVSLPSELVRQRPDIRASEALLHVASAKMGVATANLYPQITLSGNYGWTENVMSGLFKPNSNVWNYTGGLVAPLFNGGALMAQKKAAVAAFQEAAAQYRQTVLQAFQNVADTLRALQNDAKKLKDQKDAEISAHKSLAITQKQFKLGGVSYLSLLNAERQYQETRIARIQAEAARFTDTAALFQALGGGWWHRQCPLPLVGVDNVSG